MERLVYVRTDAEANAPAGRGSIEAQRRQDPAVRSSFVLAQPGRAGTNPAAPTKTSKKCSQPTACATSPRETRHHARLVTLSLFAANVR
jgi:hypothetical protein